MPTTASRREAKLSLRLTAEQRELINRAVTIENSDLSRFAAEVLVRAARRVVQEHGVSQVAEENRVRFYELLLNPPKPSKALRHLAAEPVPEGFELE